MKITPLASAALCGYPLRLPDVESKNKRGQSLEGAPKPFVFGKPSVRQHEALQGGGGVI